jgi:hypothetical protein
LLSLPAVTQKDDRPPVICLHWIQSPLIGGPDDNEEGNFRFRVLEIHRDVENPRAHIQLMCDWRIKPVEVVLLGDIELTSTDLSLLVAACAARGAPPPVVGFARNTATFDVSYRLQVMNYGVLYVFFNSPPSGSNPIDVWDLRLHVQMAFPQ